jgi:hypothetical protein
MDQLEKFEQKQVAVISKLQLRSNELAAEAKGIIIVDDESLKAANLLIKEINSHKKTVSEERTNLTAPLNNVIKQLITKEKEVLLPLEKGKSEVGSKILDYQEELENKRIAEENRIKDIIENLEHFSSSMETIEEIDMNGAGLKEQFSKLPDDDQNNPTIKLAFMDTVNALTDRKNRIEEEARAEAERIRQAEEQKRLDEAAAKQSAEETRIALERKQIEDGKREIEEQKAQIKRDQEELEQAKRRQEVEIEAAKSAKKKPAVIKSNIVTMTKYEIVDPDAVSRAYCSPDSTKINEAIKNGITTIAGVRIFTEKKVR